MLGSCKHPTENLADVAPICFQSQVLPIFQSNCGMKGCHDGAKHEGFSCADYNSVMASITPYDLKNSKAYDAIISTWFNEMPPKSHSPLTLEQRTVIAVWIQQGAKNTTCN